MEKGNTPVFVVVALQSQTRIKEKLPVSHGSLSRNKQILEEPIMSDITAASFNIDATPLQMLSPVPFEKGFHFFTNSGNYTGITATSIHEFVAKLQIVSILSIEYHFHRHDFSRWIREVIGDVELAAEIESLKNSSSPDRLRTEIVEIVQNRIGRLERLIGGVI